MSNDVLPFGTRKIGEGFPVVIIAEIGVNHEGDVKACAEMIEAAAKSGADAIKLQTIDADENYVEGTESHTLFKQCELSRDNTARMFDLARKLGMEAFTTAGDFDTIDWVDELAPAAHKVSSGLLTSTPIIKYLCEKKRTVLMSTGFANYEETDRAVSLAQSYPGLPVGVFQCTSKYPTPSEEVNLSAIRALQKRYRLPVGFSDHSMGIEASILSVASGALMLERHFTMDRGRPGYDHHISLLPREMKELVRRVREAEVFIGNPKKILSEEMEMRRKKFNRCLVARSPIKKGEKFSTSNVGIKRPLPDQRGLEPTYFESVIGQIAARDLRKDDPITESAY
jgi:N,N'-diacetyllegionaminate synthase